MMKPFSAGQTKDCGEETKSSVSTKAWLRIRRKSAKNQNNPSNADNVLDVLNLVVDSREGELNKPNASDSKALRHLVNVDKLVCSRFCLQENRLGRCFGSENELRIFSFKFLGRRLSGE